MIFEMFVRCLQSECLYGNPRLFFLRKNIAVFAANAHVDGSDKTIEPNLDLRNHEIVFSATYCVIHMISLIFRVHGKDCRYSIQRSINDGK